MMGLAKGRRRWRRAWRGTPAAALTALTLSGALLTVALPRRVQAVCPEEGVQAGLAVRLDAAALQSILGPALAALPSEMAMPASPFLLFDCPQGLDDIVLTPFDGVVHLDLTSAAVTLDDGGLLFAAAGNLDAAAQLGLTMCGAPDAICPATATASNVRLRGRLVASVSDCDADFAVSDLTLEVDPADVSVELAECGLYTDLWHAAYESFRDTFVSFSLEQLETATRDTLPQLLEEATAQLFATEVEALGLRFRVVPDAMSVAPDGVTVRFDTTIAALGARPGCAPLVDPSEVEPPAPDPFWEPELSAAPLSLAASPALVSYAVEMARLAGWLCFDSREFPELALGSYLEAVVPNAALEFRVAAAAPPTIELAPESGSDLRVVAPTLLATIDLAIGDRAAGRAAASFAASVDGVVDIDPLLRAVVVMPRALDASAITLQLEEGSFGFSQESLTGFIDTLVVPAYIENVGALPLTSTLFVGLPVLFSLDDVSAKRTQLRADLSLYPLDTSDVEPPHTIITELPEQPASSDLIIGLRSLDDTTPPEFMRHAIAIDGVWQSALAGAERVSLTSLSGGAHTITLAAVDLQGNRDPSPCEVPVIVDAVAPTVRFTAWPEGAIAPPSARVRFEGTDDQTRAAALSYRYMVSLVSRDPVPDTIVAAGDLGHATELAITALPDRATIRVTVWARDAAGNEGSAQVGFATLASPSLGCAQGAQAPWATALLLVVGVLGRVRRRRDRDARGAGSAALPLTSVALIVVVATIAAVVPLTARAAAGSAFSGPTTATGGSMHWNPAAVAGEPRGPFVGLELSGYLIHASYARQPEQPAREPEYEPVTFTLAAPDLAFTVAATTPLEWVRVIAGGFAAGAAGSDWPRDGAQRFYCTRCILVSYTVAGGLVLSPSRSYGLALAAGTTYNYLLLQYALDFGAYANSYLPAGADLFAREDPAMEGFVSIEADDFSPALIVGAWARPWPWLTLGASFHAASRAVVSGDLRLSTPPAFAEAAPTQELRWGGHIDVTIPLPWVINGEVAAHVGGMDLAVVGQYAHRTVQHILHAEIDDASPSFLVGPQLSIREAVDDWSIGVHAGRVVVPDWEAIARVDFHPRYVPKEAINASNVDFTLIESDLGARWQCGDGCRLSVTYGYYYVVPVAVEESIYNPRAPTSSGLSTPSARGRYDAWGQKLVVSFEGLWGS